MLHSVDSLRCYDALLGIVSLREVALTVSATIEVITPIAVKRERLGICPGLGNCRVGYIEATLRVIPRRCGRQMAILLAICSNAYKQEQTSDAVSSIIKP